MTLILSPDQLGQWGPARYVVEVVDASIKAPGAHVFGHLPFDSLTYQREANETSTASITVSRDWIGRRTLSEPLRPWRHNLRILRNGLTVWSGPISSVSQSGGGGQVTVEARDFSAWMSRQLLPFDVLFENEAIPSDANPIPGFYTHKWTLRTPTYGATAAISTGWGGVEDNGPGSGRFFAPSRADVFRYTVRKTMLARYAGRSGYIEPPKMFDWGTSVSTFLTDNRRVPLAPFSMSAGELRSLRDHFDALNGSDSMDIKWAVVGDKYRALHRSLASHNNSPGVYSDLPIDDALQINMEPEKSSISFDGSEMTNEWYWPAEDRAGESISDFIGFYRTYNPAVAAEFPDAGEQYPYGADGILQRNLGSPPRSNLFYGVVPTKNNLTRPQFSATFNLSPGDPIGPSDLFPHRAVEVFLGRGADPLIGWFEDEDSFTVPQSITGRISSCFVSLDNTGEAPVESASMSVVKMIERTP